jgi:DDE family transposase
MADAEAGIRQRFEALSPLLDEQLLRRFVAAEAIAAGYGGVSLVSRITNIARSTINRGIDEINENRDAGYGRVRRVGGGRKSKISHDPALLDDLKALVEPATRGDPMQPLLWTSKSLRHLSAALKKMGHDVCKTVVRDLLRSLGYSLQANAKTREGGNHPDRDAQFNYINNEVKAFQASGDPVISVDTKKKELVGDYKNNGREWLPKGLPEEVKVHAFIDPEKGKGIPYGVYDPGKNVGWVSVGINHDTAAFAVNAIRRWWQTMGAETYPSAGRLMINADCGGSNGVRVRLWKVELQKLVDELKIPITVCHLPPGTSKWNKIEHRLFSFITQNWRGKPLRSIQAIVELIGATTTKNGLKVRAELDQNFYPKGIEVTDAELAEVDLRRHDFHGDWNYTISPRLSR